MGIFRPGGSGGSGGGGLTAPVALSDLAALTASRVVVTDASGFMTAASFGASDVATLTGTQNLTNKTLNGTTNVIAGATMTLGSDATGDIYYRNASGHLTRLAISGTATDFLGITGGVPAWKAVPSGTLTFGTTPVASAGTGYVAFASAASGVINGDSNFVWDNTNKTLGVGTSAPTTNGRVNIASNGTMTLSLTGAPGTGHMVITNTGSGEGVVISNNTNGARGVEVTQSASVGNHTNACFVGDNSNTGSGSLGTVFYGTSSSTSTSDNAAIFNGLRNTNFTTSVAPIITIEHSSSGTPSTGFGAGIAFKLESTTTAQQDAAAIKVVWSTATHASRTSQLEFHLVSNAGAIALTHYFGTGWVDINNAAGEYRVNGTKVLTARQTGWTAVSGGAENKALTAYSNVTFGAAYDATVQSQLDALSQAVEDVHNWAKAIQAAITTHGLIGT